MQDFLMSPVLRSVLCKRTDFSFNPNSIIQARINRAEVGMAQSLLRVSVSAARGGKDSATLERAAWT
jgi:hypothetical protein